MQDRLTLSGLIELERQLSAPDSDRIRRQYRVLFLIEAVALSAAAVTFVLAPWFPRGTLGRDILGWMFVVPAAFQFVAISCIGSYLLGRPISLDLVDIDEPTPAGRVFIKELRSRPKISDEEFYAAYYAMSGVSRDLIDRVRSVLRRMDDDCDRATPDFPLGCLLYYLDYADLYFVLAKEFEVKAIELSEDPYGSGSIAMIVRDVVRACGTHGAA